MNTDLNPKSPLSILKALGVFALLLAGFFAVGSLLVMGVDAFAPGKGQLIKKPFSFWA